MVSDSRLKRTGSVQAHLRDHVGKEMSAYSSDVRLHGHVSVTTITKYEGFGAVI